MVASTSEPVEIPAEVRECAKRYRLSNIPGRDLTEEEVYRLWATDRRNFAKVTGCLERSIAINDGNVEAARKAGAPLPIYKAPRR